MTWRGAAAVLVVVTMPAGAAAQAPVKTADYTLEYTWPAAAARIPALKRWLEADRARLRAKTAADAAADRRERGKSDFPFHPYDVSTAWQVVADTPRFLSLSAEYFAFTGGAHGNTTSDALLWDRKVGRRLDPRALFVSAAAIQRAIGDVFCRALDRERAEKRDAPVTRGEWPDQCVPVKDTTLLLGSSDRTRFDRIGLIADAYVAGPYVEGPYEVTLPVTPALLAAVRPEYRAAFKAHRASSAAGSHLAGRESMG